MSLFLWAVIVGLVLHQTVSIIQPEAPPPRKPGKAGTRQLKFRIGRRIIVMLPARTYINLKVAILTLVSVLLALGAILIVTQSSHPTEGYAFGIADAIRSPSIASAFFGLFVGMLIGNMINRLTRAESSFTFKASDGLQIALIFLLLILGIGGDNILRSYLGRINKISFGATNEISFSDVSAQSQHAPAEQPTTAFRSAAATNADADFLQGVGSNGLYRNAELANVIARDRDYLKLFQEFHEFDSLSDEDLSALVKAEQFMRTTISPFSSCLAAIFARTANANFVTKALPPIVDELPKLIDRGVGIKDPMTGLAKPRFHEALTHTAEIAYREGLQELLSKAADNSAEKNTNAKFIRTRDIDGDDEKFIQACSALMSLRCLNPVAGPTRTPWLEPNSSQWLVEDDPSGKKQGARDHGNLTRLESENVKTVQACMKPLETASADSPIAPQFPIADPNTGGATKVMINVSSGQVKRDREAKIGSILENALLDLSPRVRKLPYLPIAYAGFLAQLGYYSGAALVIHNWISEQPKETKFPETWYLLRARFFMAGYLEEWIRMQGDGAPASLRQYHIDNFEAIVGTMKKLKTIQRIAAASGHAKLEIGSFGVTLTDDDGRCEVTAEARKTGGPPQPGKLKPDRRQELLSALHQSYVSAVAGYIDHSLKHREAARRHAATISKYTHELVTASLKCLGDKARLKKRAEIIDYYARNAINLVDKTSPYKSADKLRDDLKEAEQIVRWGLEQLETPYQKERTEKGDTKRPFMFRVSSSETIDLYARLQATQQRLKAKQQALARME